MEKAIGSKFLNGFVTAGIILTILALVGTPLVMTALLKVSRIERAVPNMPWMLAGCIYACAVPYLAALFNLKSICRLLTGENSFSPEISKKFGTIATCAFSEAVIFIAAELFLQFGCGFFLYAATIVPMVVVPLVAVTAGFLAVVMSNVFKRAAEIKEEVDLTF